MRTDEHEYRESVEEFDRRMAREQERVRYQLELVRRDEVLKAREAMKLDIEQKLGRKWDEAMKLLNLEELGRIVNDDDKTMKIFQAIRAKNCDIDQY